MRRSLALAAPILGAALLAGHAVAQAQHSAPTLRGSWKSTEVRLDDQVFSRGVVVAGKSDGSEIEDVYVPLAAFATALNGTPVLEPSLKLVGSTLLVVAVSRSVTGDAQKKGPTTSVITEKLGADRAAPHYDWIKASFDAASKDAAKMTVKLGPSDEKKEKEIMNISVNAAGVVSRDVRMFNGRAVVPIKDIARAFGAETRFVGGHYQIATAH